MQPYGCPEEANMNNAWTIHLQRLDGCSSYDRFAKNAPAIVTPAKMPVPIVLSRVEQSHVPAGLGGLGLKGVMGPCETDHHRCSPS
jgi:hypothetical protein